MKPKKYTYHKFHSFVNGEGETISCQTQLYQIGIYGIINNNPSLQFGGLPKHLVKIEKYLKKKFDNGEISYLKLIGEITVSDESGFWEEI